MTIHNITYHKMKSTIFAVVALACVMYFQGTSAANYSPHVGQYQTVSQMVYPMPYPVRTPPVAYGAYGAAGATGSGIGQDNQFTLLTFLFLLPIIMSLINNLNTSTTG